MTDLASILAGNRAGSAIGVPCFCTANEHVLRTVLAHAARTGLPAIVEATCNQVNQDGGYTGMMPADFVAWLTTMAAEAGVPFDRLVLGGDHLGPNPWRGEPDAVAMAKARDLVRLYVEAGFRKIHLDASMPLGGEAPPDFATIAARAADLCRIAEDHAPDPSQLVYVIGTEVPIPGGETEEPDALDVTSPDRLADTIETHRAAFAARGLDAAWERIAGVVVQPGVDFGHSSVYRFDTEAADPLVAALRNQPGLCFEAHSTDYQPDAALRSLVERHFAFLKVGPELTFRFREAIFALARIEALLEPLRPSRLREVIADRMDRNDRHWRDHYKGTPSDLALLRGYSYSDRIRYYWTDPAVAEALSTLLANLRATEIPETLISQEFGALDFGDIPRDPDTLIERHVLKCVSRYYRAAGMA
ncbi:class II D-tagatose-bisphosphate aldolase, non-catalytic subunit [Palleronia sp. LCG004]|uniref:class II D-tagatose-bisphosphate aldolase, non-catalytic subunit n=1 Tax=Palleronia sp. LCG004 TaxID=3079304 RepID=UPI00294395D1|nr:class II D-tagatose-bisphosphate aldolase, non-catalytic subunit [Palleronia sp. LCG004]WOI58143.1 class II D-tagatose-bisphosphate aldolase, non-catalytic subunit [Palleronia sp. LCG004]